MTCKHKWENHASPSGGFKQCTECGELKANKIIPQGVASKRSESFNGTVSEFKARMARKLKAQGKI